MTLNERLYEAAVRHAIMLLRQREGVVDAVEADVRRLDKAFKRRLEAAVSRLSVKDMERLSQSGAATTKASKALIDLLQAHANASYKAARKAFAAQARETMEYEAEFWVNRIQRELPTEIGIALVVPAVSQMVKEFNNRLVLGELPAERFRQWAQRRYQGLKRGVRESARSGNPATIVQRVTGRSGILGLGYRGLGSEVRSQHNSAIETAKLGIDAENDLISDLVWVSVLDSRTSDICFSRNGSLVNKELNGETPPAHLNCRSTTILGVKSWRQLERTGLSNSARNDLDGRLVGADSESSSTWFSRQSKTTQRDILGPTRYKLYTEGGLKFPNDFINRAEDRYTLDELKRREPSAFAETE